MKTLKFLGGLCLVLALYSCGGQNPVKDYEDARKEAQQDMNDAQKQAQQDMNEAQKQAQKDMNDALGK